MKYGRTTKGEDPKYRKIFRNISRAEREYFRNGRMRRKLVQRLQLLSACIEGLKEER